MDPHDSVQVGGLDFGVVGRVVWVEAAFSIPGMASWFIHPKVLLVATPL